MSEPSRISAPTPGTPTWESAFAAYYGGLSDYVLRFVGSAEVAEELVQDLFLHLWDTRGPGDALRLTRPYLFASARNRALKYLRHRGVAEAWIARMEREDAPSADTPEDRCLQRELRDAVQRAIAELPPRCREVFLLRRRQEFRKRFPIPDGQIDANPALCQNAGYGGNACGPGIQP
ncbi:MAG: sigma-70 family RNA polymerase sigma factor [Gemmatimonadales bacterium]